MRKLFKWIINLCLILALLYYLQPITSKVTDSIENKKTYEKAIEEKEKKEKSKEMREYDWIKIDGTNINYPVVWKEHDNQYYLKHDIYGNESTHGAIFYDGMDEPYSSHVTIIYGHCMKDGSMFNNLHKFKDDKETFLNSELIIEKKDGTDKTYKPLGVYVTNSDFFYYKLDLKTLDESVQEIQEKSKYNINVEYNENSEIIVLMTCSYDNVGDRLFAFYISE